MQTTQNTTDLSRDARYLALVSRRLDLATEARGGIRYGEGRAPEAIAAEQHEVERELAGLTARARA